MFEICRFCEGLLDKEIRLPFSAKWGWEVGASIEDRTVSELRLHRQRTFYLMCC